MLLQAVGVLMFVPRDAPDCEGNVGVGLKLVTERQAAAPSSAETFRGEPLVRPGVVEKYLIICHGHAGECERAAVVGDGGRDGGITCNVHEL